MSVLSNLLKLLIPASFRGVPFAVIRQDLQAGRRNVVHQYPGRDEPWAEDMGRAVRVYRIRGFLLNNDKVYMGGPVAAQRAMLLAAIEQKGTGTLTYPTLGVRTVVCSRFSIGEEMDAATYSELDLEFVEAGTQKFPSLLLSGSKLLSKVSLAKITQIANYVRVAAVLIGAVTQRSAASAAAQWGTKISALGRDATSVQSVLSRTQANVGRFATGGNAGVTGSNNVTTTDIETLIANAAASRAALDHIATTFMAAIDPQSRADAAGSMVASLRQCCQDPADALRLLNALTQQADAISDPSAIAIGNLVRQLAATELATAVSEYQPFSYDDAMGTMSNVASVLDQQATSAADAGQDDVYSTLRDTRMEVINDLRARAGSLARLMPFNHARPLPALVLAQEAYGDASRASELVQQAGAISPLFMPTSFKALVS
ncbi:MAG TPA: DNA circularization N-terminal domain-containing protein [Sphingobium sp.]|uniref:DNA circularization protein n=1 Tax=Sphingobium sp. TaxID=1912891 RepID=UPI002ED21B08